MRSYQRVAPVAQWIYDKIPNDEQLRIEAKLIHEEHRLEIGKMMCFLMIVTGETRGFIVSNKPKFQIDEGGLHIDVPESVVMAHRKKKNLRLGDVVNIPELTEIPIIGINRQKGFPAHYIFR